MSIDLRASRALRLAAQTVAEDPDTNDYTREEVVEFLELIAGVSAIMEQGAGITDVHEVANAELDPEALAIAGGMLQASR